MEVGKSDPGSDQRLRSLKKLRKSFTEHKN